MASPFVMHGLSALPLVLALATQAGEARLRVQARDAFTGAALDARATLTSPEAGQRLPLPLGGALLEGPPGTWTVRVEAEGYRPLSARFRLAAGEDVPVAFDLDPLAPPPRAVVARAAGRAVVHGFITDAASARPVAGARVELREPAAATTTDEQGYFRLQVRVPAGSADAPAVTSLQVSAAGYGVHEVRGLVLAEGTVLLREVLRPGEAATVRDDLPSALRAAPEGASDPVQPQGLSPGAAAPAGSATLLLPLDPPASIRVGTSCTCSTCSAVTVLSLETYVKRGLNDEWIASWNAHSLRAGAVAYRAYGAWYVEHPISGSYDICSTTCCQVNDTDTSSATDAAADRTGGYMLERAGAVFRAEYSAENNAWDDPGDGLNCSNADLSCGDGAAGSPATGWSCLADPLDAGHGCFGHGRGMCQWGTQRWASQQGRPWSWIVDHYYNDHGGGTGMRTARMSTPMVLQQARTPPAVLRGDTFTIEGTAANFGETVHARVLMGASLRRSGTVHSDPANDQPLVLAPGTSTVSRAFRVPRAAAYGVHDLLVSLYDDVDENGAINSGDLPLHLLVVPQALSVCRAPSACPPAPASR